VICPPELPLPKLMVISSGEVDGEPLPWPRLITISGVADPVEVLAEDEALVLEAPPRLMVMSSEKQTKSCSPGRG